MRYVTFGLFLLMAGCAKSPSLQAEEPDLSNYERPERITLYSPAPPQIMLHAHNVELGERLQDCKVAKEVVVLPEALPASVNLINQIDLAERPFHLPIMTTADFQTAIDDSAPEWHGYDRANTDLRFIARLYDVAFGIMSFDPDVKTPADLRGKRIGVPPRPSAVRWLTETLIRDGWQMEGQVEFVDLRPPDVMAAMRDGRIEATSWNIMSETPSGYLPLMPPLNKMAGAHFIPISDDAIDRVSAEQGFETSGVRVDQGESLQLLSFAQALAAWEDTPNELVSAIVSCLDEKSQIGFGPSDGLSANRLNWPGLSQDFIHPAAR